MDGYLWMLSLLDTSQVGGYTEDVVTAGYFSGGHGYTVDVVTAGYFSGGWLPVDVVIAGYFSGGWLH